MSKYKQLSTNENKKKTTTWKPFLWGACQIITHCVQQIKKRVQCFLSFDFIKISYGWECTVNEDRSYFDSVRWLNFVQHFQISKWRLQMTFHIHAIYFDKKKWFLYEAHIHQTGLWLPLSIQGPPINWPLFVMCMTISWLEFDIFFPAHVDTIHTHQWISFILHDKHVLCSIDC